MNKCWAADACESHVRGHQEHIEDTSKYCIDHRLGLFQERCEHLDMRGVAGKLLYQIEVHAVGCYCCDLHFVLKES